MKLIGWYPFTEEVKEFSQSGQLALVGSLLEIRVDSHRRFQDFVFELVAQGYIVSVKSPKSFLAWKGKQLVACEIVSNEELHPKG